jgi:hypothetical protein
MKRILKLDRLRLRGLGVDEGQILALLFGEALPAGATPRLIFDSSVDSFGPPTRRPR